MEAKRKFRIGKVASRKMDKTAIVTVETTNRHPLYKKVVRQQAKFKVHDEKNETRQGDVVKIVETRPLSREKRWRIAAILTRKEIAEVPVQEINKTESKES